MNDEKFDIAIVGSGIAGSALALSLANSGLRIALIEAAVLPQAMPECEATIAGFDLRVSALTRHSQRLLQRLGAWDLMAAARVSPYRKMSVWDAEGTGSIDFDAGDIHEDNLGHIVENRVIVAALMQRLRLASNIVLLNPLKLDHISQHDDSAQPVFTLSLSDGLQIQTGLIVGADGAMSRVREWAQMPTREWSYNHKGLVATVKTERSHAATAFQRFMPNGPLALLPLTSDNKDDHYVSIVWSTQPDHADELLAMSDAEFCQTLGQASEHCLGTIEAVSQRAAFPLSQRHAIDYVKPGIALIADAAHTIHPLAGQGINLGLADVAVLAEEIMRAQSRGLAIGGLSELKRYQRRRKGENLAMMTVMEGFKRLFEQRSPALTLLRNLGMRRLQQLNFAKKQIMRKAMGI